MASERVEFVYTGGGSPESETAEGEAWRSVTHVRISPSVEAIEAGAFRDCILLREVDLCGGKLRRIEDEAFMNCTSLERIHIPSTVEVFGRNAFINSTRLAELELSKGLKEIQSEAFHGCKSLERLFIPSSVKEIGKGAFANCGKLWHVEFCEGLEKIGCEAFSGCKGIKRLFVPSTVKVIEDSAFFSCMKLREVELCEGLEQIMNNAFAHCISLERVDVPSSIESICSGAFCNCENLLHFDLSSVKTIGGHAFSNCTKLKDVELFEGLENIMECTFSQCESLERVTVPSSVKMIGSHAFSSCMNLMHVDLFNGLEIIDDMAFNNCEALESIYIPISVEKIDAFAFMGCSDLTAINFYTEVEGLVIEVRTSIYDDDDDGYCGWYNMYCYMAEYKIPKRLGGITSTKWRDNIHDMIKRWPYIYLKRVHKYCALIHERLGNYTDLMDAASLLELALWKLKIAEQNSDIRSSSTMRSTARYNCGATVIIPKVLSFLVRVYSVEELSLFEKVDDTDSSLEDFYDGEYQEDEDSSNDEDDMQWARDHGYYDEDDEDDDYGDYDE